MDIVAFPQRYVGFGFQVAATRPLACRWRAKLKTAIKISDPVDFGDQCKQGALYGKITRRLMPLLFISYLFAFLDRINVGYAQLQMKPMLGFSDSVYGLGAGLFFVSYILFEIPSNIWMERIGIRFTLGRIMVLWGLTSAGTMFVRTPAQFYAARFLLGLFEAGFFPGIILYLTYWFPARRRGRVTTLFMLAIPVAGMVGGPLSGWIMSAFDMKHNLAGWQWMLFLEGLPASILGILCFFYLADSPSKASWLNDSEQALISLALVRPGEASKDEPYPLPPVEAFRTGLALLRDRQVWGLAFVYFTIACANYMYTFWLPTILKAAGLHSIAKIGWYSAIPYCFGTAGALLIGRSSDFRSERRWHVASSLVVAALALGGTTTVRSSLLLVFLLSLAAFFLYGAGLLFWALPPTYLKRETAPTGIAIVSSIGVTGGFISPVLLGSIKTHTGQLHIGILFICLLMMTGAIAVVLAVPREIDHDAISLV
jgi:sugar phosphate permease